MSKIKCNCPCHTDPNFKHIQPCCKGGYIEFPELPTSSTPSPSPDREVGEDEFLKRIDKEIETAKFGYMDPDIYRESRQAAQTLMSIRSFYLSLRQPQALPIEEGAENSFYCLKPADRPFYKQCEQCTKVSEPGDELPDIDNDKWFENHKITMTGIYGGDYIDKEDFDRLFSWYKNTLRSHFKELFSLRTQLQSLTEENAEIRKVFELQSIELKKYKNQ